MKRVDNRQYKLTEIRPRRLVGRAGVRIKKGRRFDAKLDRRALALFLVFFLAFAGIAKGLQGIDKTEEKWRIKGYGKGYMNGIIDQNASEYDSVTYKAEDAWAGFYPKVKGEFSGLSAELKGKCLDAFKEGWLEGYADGWKRNPKKNQAEKLVTKSGTVSIGMSKELLYEIFERRNQKSYKKIETGEWITFSDWTHPESGDTITFYLENGKVKGWDK